MWRTRLNLSALRRKALPRIPQAAVGPGQNVDSPNGLKVSRRQAIGLAGAAAVGMSPAVKAIGAALSGAFQLVEGRKRVSFKFEGKERWVIDPRRFSGSPQLDVQKSDDLIRVALANARYPGTDLPADMTCEIRRGVVGWRMKVKLALGGFESEVPFENWLAGVEPARSGMKVDVKVCELGDGRAVTLSGGGEAEFGPDWTVKLRGSGIARVSGSGDGIVSDSIIVSALRPDDPSVSGNPLAKRTLVSLSRGKRAWKLTSSMPKPDGWEFASSGSPFDVLSVEAGESASGRIEQAVIAEARGADSKLLFQPVGASTLDGSFALPLRDARYAAISGPNGNHSALIARFHEEPVWLHTEGCSVELGDSPDTPPFEVVARDGKVLTGCCSPALLCVVAPLIGAVAEPSRPAPGTAVRIPIGKPSLAAQSPSARKTPVLRVPAPAPAPAPKKPAPAPAPKQPIPKPDEGKVIAEPRIPTLQIPINFTVSVIRPQDLLALRFEFINLKLSSGGGPAKLTRTEAGKPAYIVVHFQPQNIGEEAFFETEKPGSPGDEKPAEPPVASRLAGTSRLVFIVPNTQSEIPYTLESLLDWSTYEQSVAPVALPPPERYIRAPVESLKRTRPMLEKQLAPTGAAAPKSGVVLAAVAGPLKGTDITVDKAVSLSKSAFATLNVTPVIQKPELRHTSIETPYHLMLSPNKYAGWAHSPKAVTSGKRTELWHTRLGIRNSDGSVSEEDNYLRALRAIWSPDYHPEEPLGKNDTLPFRMSITRWQRHQIVGLTSNFTIKGYEPLPVHAEQLMLSSLGAWMKTNGAWEHPEKLQFAVEEWRHRATMGRDNYVRVVEKGFLLPFGHRAARIWITERKFQLTPSGKMAAYLRQSVYVAVRRPEKQYPVPDQANDGRQLPFRNIRVTTLMTPALDDPKLSAVSKLGDGAFWPMVGGADFQFQVVAEDWEGKTSQFAMPLMFVTADIAFDRFKLNDAGKDYNADANDARRKAGMRGQKVAFAESSKPGDTAFEAVNCNFGAGIIGRAFSDQGFMAGLQEQDQPPFYPGLASADVKIPAIQQLLANNSTANVQYHKSYLDSGLGGANKGEVFAKLTNPVDLKFGGSAEKSAGVATPDMSIGGISRGFGPIGGNADSMASGSFNPGDFFKGALLLGSIPLDKIINALGFANVGGSGDKVPKITTNPIYEGGSVLPTAIETSFYWYTDDTTSWEGIFLNEAHGRKCKLYISAYKRTQLDGSSGGSYNVEAGISDFAIDLLPQIMSLIRIDFNSLKFVTGSGQKSDVVCDIDKVTFQGCLSFINVLEEFMSGAGFSDPPYLDVTAEHIVAGFTLPIPSVSVGVFSLQNISLMAELELPFIGDPISFRFAFCERENPFILTVSMFGGGGYFGITLNPRDGVAVVEGGFEFGGSFAMNLGVASGGVYVMAGFFFKCAYGNTELTGQFRAGGSLEILGIITISMEFLVKLTYYSNPERMYGVASLTIEIEILFFSIGVTLSVEKEFGGGGDPGFAELMSKNDWNSYCGAFA